jgi:hypothetical protein
MTDDKLENQQRPKAYDSVMPRTPFDAEYLKEVFSFLIGFKSETDPDWEKTYSEALENNRISPGDIRPVADIEGLPLPFWQLQELQRGVKHTAVMQQHHLFMEIVQYGRDCFASERHSEAVQLLNLAVEYSDATRPPQTLPNKIMEKALVLILLTEISESQKNYAEAERYQTALVNLVDECDETEMGRVARQSQTVYLRGRIERIARFCELQNKMDDARRWRAKLSEL